MKLGPVLIAQDCGANVSCLESNDVATVEAQELITVILLESDINCFLFG